MLCFLQPIKTTPNFSKLVLKHFKILVYFKVLLFQLILISFSSIELFLVKRHVFQLIFSPTTFFLLVLYNLGDPFHIGFFQSLHRNDKTCWEKRSEKNDVSFKIEKYLLNFRNQSLGSFIYTTFSFCSFLPIPVAFFNARGQFYESPPPRTVPNWRRSDSVSSVLDCWSMFHCGSKYRLPYSFTNRRSYSSFIFLTLFQYVRKKGPG